MAGRRGPKLRAGGSKLDVSYVTPQICVVGFPWRGRTERRARRNNIDGLAEFIETRHPGRYMLWNLTAAGGYDYVKFNNKVLDFECGFVDLGTPTIDQLFRLCYSFHCWLKLHRQNVVVIHGKEDPVAVGVVCACYLLYSGQADNFLDALDLFLKKRLPNWKMDCTALPASYRRALIHFHSIGTIKGMAQRGPPPLRFNCVLIYKLPLLPMRGKKTDESGARIVR